MEQIAGKHYVGKNIHPCNYIPPTRKEFKKAWPTILNIANIVPYAAEVKVLSAIGMRQILLELGPKFERATGHTLAISFDATGLIVKRIEAGENVDVVMINRSGVESLAKAGKVITVSVTNLAASNAAVAVRKGAPKADISSPEAFKRLLLSAKSIARPSPAVGGSSGDHIPKVLERLGIADEVAAKSVISSTVRPGPIADSPGYAVANGRAEPALHQLQELLVVPGIEILGPFPDELQETFLFQGAITSSAKEREAGKALINFLRTPDAKVVIKAKGLEPVAR